MRGPGQRINASQVVAVDLDMKLTPTAILHNMRLYSIWINFDKMYSILCSNAQSSYPNPHTIPRVYSLDQIVPPIIVPQIRHEDQLIPFVDVGRHANIGEEENEMRLLDSQPLRDDDLQWDDDLQFRGNGTCRQSFVPCRFSS